MTSLSTQLDINALVEMGFTKERVELAVKSVKSPDIQSVVEWLFSHPVDDGASGQRLGDSSSDQTTAGVGEQASADPTVANAAVSTSTPDTETPMDEDGKAAAAAADTPSTGTAADSESTQAAGGAALSLVCEDCGKQIRSELDAQTHAARTGHQHFAESSEAIKPLTAEEKEEQKVRLQQKLEERRKERELAEKEQNKLREKTRRRTGKEITQAKEEQEMKEMKRLAEERRQEKKEELRLKQKLKDDIARDRAEFKRLNAPSATTVAAAKPVADTPPKPVVKKEYNTARIQFRMSDGSTQNSTFQADDSLQVVYDYLSDKVNTPFELLMTFPRKVFNDEDKCKTLKELKLVPSAALVLKAL